MEIEYKNYSIEYIKELAKKANVDNKELRSIWKSHWKMQEINDEFCYEDNHILDCECTIPINDRINSWTVWDLNRIIEENEKK